MRFECLGIVGQRERGNPRRARGIESCVASGPRALAGGRVCVSVAVKADKSRPAAISRAHRLGGAKPKRLGVATFSLAMFAALLAGWVHRDDDWISPQTGLGYQLGIIGSLMMLALLLYPLRKRYANLEWLGRVGDLFRIHMVLGILGPLLIVLHCNFRLGSINSNVALGAMLLVVASGLVGRYLYGQIHVGLYGRKSELNDLIGNVDAIGSILGHDLQEAPQILDALRHYQARILRSVNPLNGLDLGPATRGGRKVLGGAILTVLDRQAKLAGWPPSIVESKRRAALQHLEQYLTAIRKAAALAFFERLFAIWHVLHMPMFFLLMIAAVVHIVAVHLY